MIFNTIKSKLKVEKLVMLKMFCAHQVFKGVGYWLVWGQYNYNVMGQYLTYL